MVLKKKEKKKMGVWNLKFFLLRLKSAAETPEKRLSLCLFTAIRTTQQLVGLGHFLTSVRSPPFLQ